MDKGETYDGYTPGELLTMQSRGVILTLGELNFILRRMEEDFPDLSNRYRNKNKI